MINGVTIVTHSKEAIMAVTWRWNKPELAVLTHVPLWHLHTSISSAQLSWAPGQPGVADKEAAGFGAREAAEGALKSVISPKGQCHKVIAKQIYKYYADKENMTQGSLHQEKGFKIVTVLLPPTHMHYATHSLLFINSVQFLTYYFPSRKYLYYWAPMTTQVAVTVRHPLKTGNTPSHNIPLHDDSEAMASD